MRLTYSLDGFLWANGSEGGRSLRHISKQRAADESIREKPVSLRASSITLRPLNGKTPVLFLIRVIFFPTPVAFIHLYPSNKNITVELFCFNNILSFPTARNGFF